MQHIQEADLAWSLITAAKPHLDTRERNHVFVSVGAGDSFSAIRVLLKLIAAKQICLQPALARSCTTWLRGYALHEDHERLRLLIEGVKVSAINQQWAIGRSPSCTRGVAALAVSTVAYQRVPSAPMRTG